jgi:DNA-binding NarL/FixJ family response regulator
MIRVFMLSHLPLFSQGVEALLCREQGVEIVGRETDVEKAVERIKELEPDVVILDNDLQATDPAPIAVRILGEQTKTKVIGLSLQSNTIYIYRKEQRTAHRIEDLMEAIKNNLSKEPRELSNQSVVEQRNRQDKEDA